MCAEVETELFITGQQANASYQSVRSNEAIEGIAGPGQGHQP